MSKSLQFTFLLLEHVPYLVVLVTYFIIGSLIGNFFCRDILTHLKWRYEIISSLSYLFFLCFLFIYVIIILTRIVAKLIENLPGRLGKNKSGFGDIITIKRVGGFIIIYATMPIFLSVFSNIKQLIPFISPFTWDRFFMDLDRVLHGGHHPWILLQPILGYPALTKIIDYIYVSWFIFLFAFMLWMAWSNNRKLRAQFFLSFVFIWILIGTLLATIFSSAGPCYYSDIIGGANPFGPLISYLDTIHENGFLYARKYQKGIWEAYTLNTNLPFGGISAMPSVHVATAVLFALAAWGTNRILGVLFTAYALLIQIGSVHLGWHYAVDGYFSAMLTFLIWNLADRILKGLAWESI